jgi:hypothetical protein
VQAVRAGTVASAGDDYPNRRSELWFHAPFLARDGKLSLARLPRDVLGKLRQQAMAPLWKQDSKGRRVVESKAETKKRLGRSPDEMDALNLALAPSHWFEYRSVERQVREYDTQRGELPFLGVRSGGDQPDTAVQPPPHPWVAQFIDRTPRYQSNAERRGLFGRGRR